MRLVGNVQPRAYTRRMTDPADSQQAAPPPARAELPHLTSDLPGVGGLLKRAPDDFIVEEIPAYEPSSEGEHLFLWIEKRDTSAEDLTRHLARVLNVDRNDIGVAGLKDRRAVTRQFVSVPAVAEPQLNNIDTDSIRLLASTRHQNKLRTGHLRGNRFSILIRDVVPNAHERAVRIAAVLEKTGFPNYFGQQRFGNEGGTLETGFDLLRGIRKPRDLPRSRQRFLLRLSLSAVQSELFNRVLSERITDGLIQTVLDGDVMQVVESRGCFVVEDADREQQRFNAQEIVTTGPMFGPKMKQPAATVADREAAALESCQLEASAFTTFRKLTSGTRRPLLIHPQDLSIDPAADGLRFQFALPSGTYATTLLREFTKSDDTAYG